MDETSWVDTDSGQAAEKRGRFSLWLKVRLLVDITDVKGDGQTLTDYVEEALETALRKSRGQALEVQLSHRREAELFCLLANAAPERLSGLWYWVYEVARHDASLWLAPQRLEEAGCAPAPEPYLDVEAVAAQWQFLVDVAEANAAQRIGPATQQCPAARSEPTLGARALVSAIRK